MSHLFLIGFMGAGKSVVGREVARRSGWRFVDLDAEVESAAGRTVSEIFDAEGEPAFRAAEREALKKLEGAEPAVVACGGGIVLDAANRADLKRLGRVVWLRVDARSVLDRVGGRPGRPLLEGSLEDVDALLGSRESLYRTASDVVVETSGRDADAVADDIAALAEVA